MTYYPESASYYDQLLNDVVFRQDHCMPSTVSTAMQQWKQLGNIVQDLLRPAGTASNGTATSDKYLAPQMSVDDLVRSYLPGWTGSARDELVKQSELIREFGWQLGTGMYAATAGKTFHDALKDLSDAITYITEGYYATKKAYSTWVSTMASNLASFSGGTLGTSNLTQGLSSNWAPNTQVTWAPSSTRYPTTTINFAINDGQETQTIPVAGAVGVVRYVASYGVTESPQHIAAKLTSSFTRLLAQHLGALADKITGSSSAWMQAGHTLPGKADASSLPPGSSTGQGHDNGNGNSGGWTPSSSFSGTSPPAGAPTGFAGNGLHGTGSAGGADTTGLGRTSGANGHQQLVGNGPTQLAGFTGAGPGVGVGPGGIPLGTVSGAGGTGFGPAGINDLTSGTGGLGGGIGPGAIPVGGPLVGGVGGLPEGLGGIGGAGSALDGGASGLGGFGSVLGTQEGLAPGGVLGAGGAEPMSMMPPMMPGMLGNGGNSRQRKSWLGEDEDVWADAGFPVPPVINAASAGQAEQR